MKKLMATIVFLGASLSAQAAPITVNIAFTGVAAGSMTYDSSLDGTIIDYSDLSAFNLTFQGETTNSYDLAFINSGGFTNWRFLNFDSATDTFVTATIDGFPTTLAALKSSYNAGFFVRDDSKVMMDYNGGSARNYESLQINVDRGNASNEVPLPTTLLLSGAGLLAMACARRRKA